MSDSLAERDLDAELEKLERYAVQMDALVRIPGTRLTFGVDAVLGLVPVLGDTLSLFPSLYILAKGHRLGASSQAQGRMLFNICVDYVIGMVPVIGDLFDFGWRANIRNARILREELGPANKKGRPDYTERPQMS